MLKIKDILWQGKVALVRADLNVPIEKGVIKDATRIKRSLATFEYIIGQGGICTIMSHLGRPEGYNKDYSLKPIAKMLEDFLDKKVLLLNDFDSDIELSNDYIYLYENTRFFSGETTNSEVLSKKMSSCCDVYVMDAFASSHRMHASTYGVMNFSKEACVGFLLDSEVAAIKDLFLAPKRPVLAVVGGAKITGKIDLLDSLLDFVDVLAVVGGMANTFLKAKSYNIGKSLCENDKVSLAKKLSDRAASKGVVLYLPHDFIVANPDNNIDSIEKNKNEIIDGDIIYDVGSGTCLALEEIIKNSSTVIWNGPLGMFENRLYSKGSLFFAKTLAGSDAYSIIGGGDTLRVVAEAGVVDYISYTSTGGGAFLDLLANRSLPALDLLKTKVINDA
ncbi:MAG: phosphoglycerate kinase [Legionellales bacterium]|jgi:phosphoglycerate kinase|nr:phosphoglycerate kinase [Legionellales bacterium]